MATDEDFSFVLSPNTHYWFVVSGAVWNSYRKQLKSVFGKGSFRTVQATEKAVEIDESWWDTKPPERKVLLTWVHLEIGPNPIEVSATIMGPPHLWNKGDNPQSTGAFETPEPSWILSAEEAVAAIRDWAGDITTKAEEFGEAVAEKAERVYDKVTEAPEKFLEDIEERAGRVAWLLVAGGLGALAIWKVTTR